MSGEHWQDALGARLVQVRPIQSLQEFGDELTFETAAGTRVTIRVTCSPGPSYGVVRIP